MLRLERRVGQRVIITAPDGTAITIDVKATQKNRAVLLFDAPLTYRIDREEVVEVRKARERAEGCGQ